MPDVTIYQHLFFDLDHTLWDFESNSEQVLTFLFDKYGLRTQYDISREEFIVRYHEINAKMWQQFHRNEISRSELRSARFAMTLAALGVKAPRLAHLLADEYLELLPRQKQLLPDACMVLDYLKTKYRLHLITNGFEKVQRSKLFHACLESYFDHIFISEEIGYKKPEPEIFEYALRSAGAKKTQSLMIGDDWDADIMGALQFGMEAIYFNPSGKTVSHNHVIQIRALKQLMHLL
jgi:putative hydrolase of the HAD superfamily